MNIKDSISAMSDCFKITSLALKILQGKYSGIQNDTCYDNNTVSLLFICRLPFDNDILGSNRFLEFDPNMSFDPSEKEALT